MNEVLTIVTDFYSVYPKSVLSCLRKRKIMKCRQVSIFIVRELSSLSTTEIGVFFKRDRASIIHSSKALRKDIATDETYRYEVFHLLEKARKMNINFTGKFCKPTTFKIIKSCQTI